MAGDKTKRIAVIMAGGSGTRFWPLSRKEKPKQYLELLGKRTLIQQTVDRISSFVQAKDTFVVSTESQKGLLQEQLPDLGGWILEPSGKNTAPCLMLTALDLQSRGYSAQSVLIVLPADHHIADTTAFKNALTLAETTAREESALVTLGIRPSHAHTGYGYIEAGAETHNGVHEVRKFVEKPNFEKAAQYLQAGNYLWNGGIFVWTLETLIQSFEKYCPESWALLKDVPREKLQSVYSSLPSEAIDTAVLEKADKVRVVPVEMGWSDIGSWDALYRLLGKDAQQNALLHTPGDKKDAPVLMQSQGCLVEVPKGKKVALIGAKNLIVIDTGDALLIADRSLDQHVRAASKELDP